MATILDYTFDRNDISNPDGGIPITLPLDAHITSGPGSSKSVQLGPSGGIQADISAVACSDIFQFHVRVVFNLDSEFDGRQILAECEKIPFSLELIGVGSSVRLIGSVCSAIVDWRSAESNKTDVTPGEWHSADLIYDSDTLTVFLDNRVVGCHGFGATGILEIEPSAKIVLIGGNNSSSFRGRIATFKLSTSIPSDLGTLAGQQRETPQWHITTKVEMIRNIYDLGLPSAPATLIPHLSSWWQPYSKGAIMFHSETAFEIHGKILERYNSLSDSVKETLGYLISDEQPTYKPHGRKSMFQSGAIYWSPTTGAFEVAGEIFQDYQATGESETWGFPVEEALPANGGLLQQMQRATWYFKYGTRRAHAVEGEILAAFAKTGGLGRWGYPISNEVTIDVTGIGSRDVRWSEFENGSFYWSAATGAHAVEGDIRTKWRYLGGADMHYIQELGLPTTDEMDVPDRKGARMSGFEQGVVLWYGSKDKMLVVYPFKLCICTLSTARSGSTEGPNDIYFTAIVNRGEETIFVRRYPETKAFAKADEVDVNVELPVVLKPQTDASILLKVDVWDHEESGEHLNLGTWVQVLDASNAWGLEGGGKLNSGHIQKIKNISAEIKPQIEYLYD